MKKDLKNGDNNIIGSYLSKCNLEVKESIIINHPDGTSSELNNFKNNIKYFLNSAYNDKEFSYWYEKTLKKEIIDIFTFLESCSVKLGKLSWDVVTKEGNKLTKDKLINIFKPVYNEEFIKKYFTDWKEEQMILESEKIMGIMY